MKKSLIVLATLGAFAGVASAQSSVTLFGVVDLSVNSFKNGGVTQKTMDSNQLNSNRLGFRGTEDLGGGMTASFWLEGGMANDTGSPAGFNFQRRSTVSLSGGFGEIRMGRDYVNTFSTVASNDVYGANGQGSPWNIYLGAPAALGSGVTTGVRANNMVGYFLPAMGGIYGSVQVAAGEGVSGNKYIGGRLGYAAGPVDVSASVSTTENTTSNKYKVVNFGGSYNFGVAKLYAFYDQRKYANLKYTIASVTAGVSLGQGEFRIGYTKGNTSGGTAAQNGTDATVFGAEYIYNLSKRTALYGQFARLENDGASAIALGGSTAGAGTGFNSTGYGVGVRHSF